VWSLSGVNFLIHFGRSRCNFGNDCFFLVARRVQLGDGVSKLRNGATGPAGASVGAQAIGYALLPFFAKNVLISAFVGSRKGCWLFPARAVPVRLGNRA
jgi:hypothetical protein